MALKYRDRIDTISQVLEAANGGNVTKTKITYKALVGYNQLEQHLIALIAKGLLRYDKEIQTFKTTEKGLRFLQIYNMIEELTKAPEQTEQQQQLLTR